jgi:hypothetical protein
MMKRMLPDSCIVFLLMPLLAAFYGKGPQNKELLYWAVMCLPNREHDYSNLLLLAGACAYSIPFLH